MTAVQELGRLTGRPTPAIDMVLALVRRLAIERGCYPACLSVYGVSRQAFSLPRPACRSGHFQRTLLFRRSFGKLRSGKTGGPWLARLVNKMRPSAARPAISVPVRSAARAGCGDVRAFAPDIAAAGRGLPSPVPPMCSSSTHRPSVAGRGTLGRNLPGPAATLAARRRRRSFPTKHRHEPRSRWEELPRRIREVLGGGDKHGEDFWKSAGIISPGSLQAQEKAISTA